jgi:hypothetical protein
MNLTKTIAILIPRIVSIFDNVFGVTVWAFNPL